ncbi:putative ribonuclease H-like domain-containing protein [Tanacetum coccineum]
MWRSIEKGPYERPLVTDPDDDKVQILEPLSKMTESNKKQYIADVKVMNYLLQAIPNDIYNLVDACKNAKEIWERIKRLMLGSDVTNHVRHLRLIDEVDKFAAKEGESLESVYERLTTLVNIMDRNNVRSIPVSINTKFLNCLQPEWSKYVTMSHANPSSSHSPQPYYVTHPSSVIDYEEYYQGELQGDSQEDKLTTAMMLLARAITQNFSTPTNNRLRTSSNTRNQAVIQDGRQNRNQAFNAGNRNDESNQIVQRVPRTESNSGKAHVQCYNCNEKGHYARDCLKPRVRDAKYFREQILLAMKDEAGSNLNDEENDFMLDNSFRDETLEELTDAVIMMARIQPADDNGVQKPNYDAKAVKEVNASYKMIPKGIHEHKNHGKHKIVINTSDDDQIDYNIIFDDPFTENNGGSDEHDSNAHDQYHDLAKKAFKERKDRYLEDIVDHEEKLSSYDRTVYKMGQLIQTIHMLGKTPNQVYDPFLKAGLGYKNLERLKKAIAAQPKMYHGEKLYSTKLKIDSPDSEETLEDAEESRLKMRNKMVQLDYNKLNVLYETFVPQKESSVHQTYFSIISTSNTCSESNEVKTDSQIPKMPKESKLLKMFEKMALAINALRDRIDVTLLEYRKRRWMSDS